MPRSLAIGVTLGLGIGLAVVTILFVMFAVGLGD